MSVICELHNAEMIWKTGVSKNTGKSYAFWSCPKRNPDGSFCKFKPPNPPPPTEVQSFSAGLDEMAQKEEQQKKGRLITKAGLANAFIRAGKEPNNLTLNEAEKWLKWIYDTNTTGSSNFVDSTSSDGQTWSGR